MSWIMVAVAATQATVATVKLVSSLVGRKKRRAEQAKAKLEQEKYKQQYMDLDTSNPYANMENTMEDLTINQKQSELINQQGQQQRANIMQKLQGAAGGSGIAALAQTMANKGQLASQQAGADIGRQEAANQKAAAKQAAAIDLQFRKGEARSQDLEFQKTATLYGMASGRKGAADKAIAQAKAQQMNAAGEVASSAGDAYTGYQGAQAKTLDPSLSGTTVQTNSQGNEVSVMPGYDADGNPLPNPGDGTQSYY